MALSNFIAPRAKKSLGQNFLVDSGVVTRILNALDPQSDETIIEIGPGRGALTGELLKRAGRVVAVELDRVLVPLLQEKFAAHDNFSIIEADALSVEFAELIAPAQRARVVANLPYNISTAILQRLLAQRETISEAILMLQKEVVERITAPAGHRERGFLSVFVEAYAEAVLLFEVAPTAFRPVPKVWSAVARLRMRPQAILADCDEVLLWQLVSAGFAQRRKTLANNLKAAPPALQNLRTDDLAEIFARAAVAPHRRAETLTFDEWTQLTHCWTAS